MPTSSKVHSCACDPQEDAFKVTHLDLHSIEMTLLLFDETK